MIRTIVSGRGNGAVKEGGLKNISKGNCGCDVWTVEPSCCMSRLKSHHHSTSNQFHNHFII